MLFIATALQFRASIHRRTWPSLCSHLV